MVRSVAMRWGILAVILLGMLVVAWFQAPLPQPQSYHDLADRRALLGIPNAMDVLSNLPFLLFSLYGFSVLRRSGVGPHFVVIHERRTWNAFFLSTLWVTVASGYYHWAPGHWGLMWDRLPIVIGFMVFFGLMLAERVSLSAGLRLIPWMVCLAVAVVVLWYRSETLGAGDMRAYVLLQLYPMVAVVVMLAVFPSRYTQGGWLWGMLGAYTVSKVLELGDETVFTLTGGMVSGHSLKHVAAAMAVWCAAEYIRRRDVKEA